MMKKKIVLMLTISLILVFSQATLAAPPSDKGKPGKGGDGDTKNITYVALGDSIAYGIGATNYYGYTDMYKDDLLSAKKGTKVDYINKAIPGMKTGGFIIQLSLDWGLRSSIQKANKITISIGGNNLLECASNNYSAIDTTCAEDGVANFVSHWESIIGTIRNLNSTAEVKVLNLYNPYESNEGLYDTANGSINSINGVLESLGDEHIYTIVDVNNAFSSTFADGSFKVSTYTHFSNSNRDPHPTDEGYRVIADLHK
jgi:lysophospholipase L1-like esterase